MKATRNSLGLLNSDMFCGFITSVVCDSDIKRIYTESFTSGLQAPPIYKAFNLFGAAEAKTVFTLKAFRHVVDRRAWMS